jgi:hypothetical protein
MKSSDYFDNQDDDDDDQRSGEDSDPKDRWDDEVLKEMEGMDFVCTFLDNEEDTLPDLFDPKKVKKQQAEDCHLCSRQLGGRLTLGASSNTKRHHCRKCGQTVC